jgi:putative CRISPR-associated protein, VVA1548 family
MTTYFVTRHQGALDWARKHGHDDVVALSHLDTEAIEALGPGDAVLGTLPVNLAADVCARGASYLHLSINLDAEARGRPLSADEMELFGARLERFSITREA